MAEGSVKVKGLRELDRAFRRLDADVAKEVRAELTEVARPIAETAKAKLARYPGVSLETIIPKTTAKGALVVQNKRKVSGRRSDFGALQMRQGLIPARSEHTSETVRGVEHVLDWLGRREGF
jgi:phage host-nuclease inhibitor protein Gam